MGSFKPYSGSGRNAKIIQLQTSSGKVMQFDDYRKRLMTLSMPDGMRLREIRKVLMAEARPFVHRARQAAYEGSEAIASATTKRRSSGGSWFYNLYSSIGAWSNRGLNSAYVVIGLKNQKKKGAYYAGWQLTGLGPSTWKKSKNKKNIGRTFGGYTGKNFLEDAAKDQAAIMRSTARLQKYIYNRLAKFAA